MTSLIEKAYRNDVLRSGQQMAAYAPEWAAYKQALLRVTAATGLDSRHGPLNALTDADEAAVALVNAAWLAGVEVGVAFGRAEASLDAAYQLCGGCNGYGVLRRDGTACAGCGGRGIVEAIDCD